MDVNPAPDPMISTDALVETLGAPGLVVVDASWFMPGTPRDPRAEYAAGHIPGAVYFNIDEVADHASDLPHMLPDPAEFAVHARRLGVEPGSRVVVYDSQGLYSAARVWWTFRVMGLKDVFVLDGGLPRWIAERHPVEQGWVQPPHGEFKAHYDAGLVRSLDQVRHALEHGSEQLVDARSGPRFRAEEPEPRPGVCGGHMPGARNLHYARLITPDGGLESAEHIRMAFEAAGVDLDRGIATTCGSGVTAAILALALARIGRGRTPVYDGSWSEWGARADTPVVTGA